MWTNKVNWNGNNNTPRSLGQDQPNRLRLGCEIELTMAVMARQKSGAQVGASSLAYPPWQTILFHFVHLYVIQQGLVGAALVRGVAPIYLWTRDVARENEVGDALYFAVALSLLHSFMYLMVNVRK